MEIRMRTPEERAEYRAKNPPKELTDEDIARGLEYAAMLRDNHFTGYRERHLHSHADITRVGLIPYV
jgi:hypothetical protein